MGGYDQGKEEDISEGLLWKAKTRHWSRGVSALGFIAHFRQRSSLILSSLLLELVPELTAAGPVFWSELIN